MNPAHHTESLSREFARLMRLEIPDALERAVALNKAETDPGVCHTHDFCDANEVMLEAFQNILGKEPDMLAGDDNPAEIELWNQAWNLAESSGFYVETPNIDIDRDAFAIASTPQHPLPTRKGGAS